MPVKRKGRKPNTKARRRAKYGAEAKKLRGMVAKLRHTLATKIRKLKKVQAAKKKLAARKARKKNSGYKPPIPIFGSDNKVSFHKYKTASKKKTASIKRPLLASQDFFAGM